MVLGRALPRALVRARRELQEVSFQRRGTVWLVGEEGIERDRRPEGPLEELERSRAGSRRARCTRCGSFQATPPARRTARARAPRSPTGSAAALPDGGAGAKRAKSPKNSAARPSGVKLIIPIVPPGRQTRRSSSATFWWSGANIAPNEEVIDVELALAEGERLGVRLHPLELDPLCACLAAARLEVLRREVRGHHLRPGLGGADGDVARSRGHVEHALTGRDPTGRDEHGPEPPDRLLRERVVVAERPHRPFGSLVLSIELRRRYPDRSHLHSYLLDPCERCRPQQVSRRALTRHAGHRSPGGRLRLRPKRPSLGAVAIARFGYVSSRPARTAWAAAAVRDGTSSLRRMLVTWR